MFSCLGNKGFQLTFANGYTVSVQFSPFNYCEHLDTSGIPPRPASVFKWSSEDAEIAVWVKNKEWRTKEVIQDLWGRELGDDMMGYVSTDEVAIFIAYVQKLPKEEHDARLPL